MIETADIVVIGAGVIGSSIACHLARRGERRIIVLESEAELGTGSTGKATGGVRTQFGTDVNARLSQYSIEYFRTRAAETGYDPKGYLFFATKPEQLEYLRSIIERLNALGVEDVREVSPAEIAELVPILKTDDILGGSFGASDGFIDPIAVMTHFISEATALGARLRRGSRAVALETDARGISAVRTEEGRIEARTVILATGPTAAVLAGGVGLDVPVSPECRKVVWARAAQPLPADLPMVIDIGSGFHFRPGRDFRNAGEHLDGCDVVFASPCATSSSEELVVDDAFIDAVVRDARNRSDALGDTVVIREKCRAGFYENTPDHHAIIGESGIDGLFLACGFSGHGVMHSPAAGKAISEIVLDGGSVTLDVSMLGLDRFASGNLLEEKSFI